MLRLLSGWFYGLVVISLVDYFRPDSELIYELSSELSCGLMTGLWPGHGWFCGLTMAWRWTVLGLFYVLIVV